MCSEIFLQPVNRAAVYSGTHWVVNYFTESTSPLFTEKWGEISHPLCTVRKCCSGFTHGVPIILLINCFLPPDLLFTIGVSAYSPKSHLLNQSFFPVISAAFEGCSFGPSRLCEEYFVGRRLQTLTACELWNFEVSQVLMGMVSVTHSALG